ncbi:MAG TPA: Hpt domain-containing protein [Roseiflexaceae bacterium]|jgi:HPt (histidine-containing phosphotransfer) domain-containing protein
MSEHDTIDRAALDDLLATMGGDSAFLAELIDTYFEDSESLLPAMRQALASGSADELRRAAHSLKSNSASFGAQELAVLCRELEEQGRAGTLRGASERLAQVEAEYERVRRALQAARPTA